MGRFITKSKEVVYPLYDSDYLSSDMTIDSISEDYSIAAIIRNEKIIIPNKRSEIKSADELLIFTKPEHAQKAESLFVNK